MTTNDINETIEALRNATALPVLRGIMNRGADVIQSLASELRTCNNELCLYCGAYKNRHNGACDGCRWRIDREIPESRTRRETR